jgi:phage-related protein
MKEKNMPSEIKVKLSSPWVQEFIRQHGGVLNITWRTVCMD